MNWQPIHTAPRDGTKILGYCPKWGIRETRMRFYKVGSLGFKRWQKGEGPQEMGWEWQEHQNNWSSTWQPLQWQPLPEPP